MAETLDQLIKAGVNTVRLSYPDLHGIARGKEFPVSFFEHLVDDGAAHCEAIMTVDLRHNVVAGFEHGFQDIVARPDTATLAQIPGIRPPPGASPNPRRRAAPGSGVTRAAVLRPGGHGS